MGRRGQILIGPGVLVIVLDLQPRHGVIWFYVSHSPEYKPQNMPNQRDRENELDQENESEPILFIDHFLADVLDCDIDVDQFHEDEQIPQLE